jgi:hypothetical protein
MVNPMDPLIALIQAVAVLIGALVPIALSILAFVKAHTNSKNIQRTVNSAENIVNSLAETDKWVLSHQQGLTKLVEAAATIPDIKRAMDTHSIDITKMKQDLDATTAEIKNLYDTPSTEPVTNADPVERGLKEIDQRTKVTRA